VTHPRERARRGVKRAWVCAAAAVLGGCTDAFVGDWTSDQGDCSDWQFTADEDGTGDGHIFIEDCVRCEFDIEWTNEGDGDYQVEVDFDDCECDGATKGEAACELDDDGEELECDLELGSCQLGSAAWEKDT
jgi:hypothetical protein